MPPYSTGERKARDISRASKLDGCSQEIQRLIGRSGARGGWTWKSWGNGPCGFEFCETLRQPGRNGGTRTASITGDFIAALELAIRVALEKEIAG